MVKFVGKFIDPFKTRPFCTFTLFLINVNFFPLASFGPPSLASCHCFALLFLPCNVNHLNSANPCSPSVPLFCSSFTYIALIFLPCSPLVPSSGSFHLPLCFFVFLVPSRSPSSIEPCQSFFLVPLPFSFFSLISVPRSFLRSLRFLLGGPVVPCTSKK